MFSIDVCSRQDSQQSRQFSQKLKKERKKIKSRKTDIAQGKECLSRCQICPKVDLVLGGGEFPATAGAHAEVG